MPTTPEKQRAQKGRLIRNPPHKHDLDLADNLCVSGIYLPEVCTADHLDHHVIRPMRAAIFLL